VLALDGGRQTAAMLASPPAPENSTGGAVAGPPAECHIFARCQLGKYIATILPEWKCVAPDALM
jgi:hypothetical protein